jgi:uncharacterized SAM-binding protein YcdF (DUF218 family)
MYRSILISRGKNEKENFISVIVNLVIILGVFAIAALEIYTYSLKTWKPIKSDAAIVLGAAVWNDIPSPVFRERINYSIKLYKDGVIKKIIFTGGRGDSNEEPDSAVAMRYAIEKGVPQEDILIETNSKITEENLKSAELIARKNNLKSFLIVSDPLHMRRALLMAKDQNIYANPAPTPTTRYISISSKLDFLVRETFFFVGYLFARIIR